MKTIIVIASLLVGVAVAEIFLQETFSDAGEWACLRGVSPVNGRHLSLLSLFYFLALSGFTQPHLFSKWFS